MKNLLLFVLLSFASCNSNNTNFPIVSEKKIGMLNLNEVELKYRAFKTGIDNFKIEFFIKETHENSKEMAFAHVYLNDAATNNLKISFQEKSDSLIIVSNYPFVCNEDYYLFKRKVIFKNSTPKRN